MASRLCDEAKPGQILISPRVLTKVENAVQVEPVSEFELKGIRRPLAAYNVVARIWFGVLVGSTIGGFIPGLWGAGLFSYSSVLFSGLGALVGLWLGYKLR